MSNFKSILDSEYIVPTRPYSQNELKYLEENLYKNIRLGDSKTFHSKCGHFYYVKENSRKEKEIKEKNITEDIGNCSVCWKLHKTPDYLKDKAYDMVESYCKSFYTYPEKLTYSLIDLEIVFYKWLYFENYKY